ncbi:MAG: mltG [Burkholderiales bacterium]|jgi:UPF0755 protein|nr:mltG [Burkholderiales bacterium]
MIKKPKKTNIFIKIILLIFVVSAIYIGNVVFFPASLPGESYRLIIDRQVNLRALAFDLESKGIIKNARVFLFLLRIMHEDRKVTAGLYILNQPMSIWKLIARITNGHPDKLSVTLIDGWVTSQIRAYINSLLDIQHITAKMSDDELRMALKIQEPSLEGIFYPSTYFVAPNQTDLEIYQQAYHTLQDKLTALYAARSTSAYYSSPYQLLIMASLIHKETAKPQDMYLVSTVFNNRLRKGMKLQDDPSVFYGLKGIRDGKIVRADFQIDTPYNTYLRLGLPPTPICTPSDAALKAASQPLNRPDLMYFVAIGSGKTQFSDTYNQHMSAVNRYLKKPAAKLIERHSKQAVKKK